MQCIDEHLAAEQISQADTALSKAPEVPPKPVPKKSCDSGQAY